MAKSWIAEIVNTSNTTFYMWSRDVTNHGEFYDLNTGKFVGSNQKNSQFSPGYHVLTIPPGAQYRGEGAGIAWYRDGQNYRALSTEKSGAKNALLMWQTTLNKFDGITMLHGDDRKAFAHVKADAAINSFLLSISGEGPDFEIDLELRRTDNTEAIVYDVFKKVVVDAYEDLRAIRVEAGKAAAKAFIAAV
jgi:hypothetical protein